MVGDDSTRDAPDPSGQRRPAPVIAGEASLHDQEDLLHDVLGQILAGPETPSFTPRGGGISPIDLVEQRSASGGSRGWHVIRR